MIGQDEGKKAIEQMLGINLDDLVNRGSKTEQQVDWLVQAVQVLDRRISEIVDLLKKKT